jgi:origin recognition complex subunit 1
MSLTNPNLVYTILCEKIIGRRMNPQSSAQFLSDFFKKSNSEKQSIVTKYMSKSGSNRSKKVSEEARKIAEKVRVVLIDELDALITSKQTLLYNLFDWPCYKDSKLLLISIANTMDLPERLQQKITSRIGNNRLVYEPYTSSQIKIILESRLKDIEIFEQRSLELVSKKVAQYSGDIRRSL